MGCCGVNIPLKDIAEALVNEYGDVFKQVAIDKLPGFVLLTNGEATNLTLRGGITLDDVTKQQLCAAMSACTGEGVISEFSIDEVKDHLALITTTAAGITQSFFISRVELENWLKLKGGGIVDGKGVGDTITVNNKDGTTATIDVSGLIPKNSPYVDAVAIVGSDLAWLLEFTRTDNVKLTASMEAALTAVADIVYERVMRTGRRLNTQEADYVLAGDDFNGRTVIRANADGNQTITVTKPPSEDFIGKEVIIRKSKGEPGAIVTLAAGDGVTLLPDDGRTIRRFGGVVSLMYVGDGVYDISGELP